MDINAVTTSYARWAPIYDKTFGAVTNVGRRRTVQYLNQHGPKVLEVGVGTGLALRAYDPAMEVTGIDFSEDMLAKASAKVKNEGLTHVKELRQMDARSLDFPDNSFDAVAAMNLMSVVPNPEQVLAEMARVCKPGGKVVITNHFARDKGFLAMLERLTVPLENLLGWHSDFEKGRVLGDTRLEIVAEKPFPPFGMMTFLVQEKRASA